MTFFDTFSESSRLKDIKTSQKALFFIVNIIIIFAFDNIYLSLISLIALTIINNYLVEDSHLRLFKLILIPCAFLITGILPIIFEVNNQNTMFSFNLFNLNLGITQKSMQYASLTLFKSLAIVLCSYFLILNTRMNNLFNFMHKMKVPILLVNMFELTYRFIYIILNQTMKIKNAQEARLGYINFKTSLSSFALMAKNTFIKSFERISSFRTALDSRLYDEEINYYISEENFSNKFFIFSIVYCITLVLIGWMLT